MIYYQMELVKQWSWKEKGGFLSMLLGTSAASLLENMLVGKEKNREEAGFLRAGYGSSIRNMDF